ncbi:MULTISPECIES: SulP family inorganic anion transporter [Methylosinus]|uniref:SulP family inorganic anion transporter n=1 Tax=Methylosinus trichosporium (strain ATCC 35070 / NCIMB 11131 / UNIQEM 75 / OB3b) TaxID=595536 RepID=A0A2D2D3H8_METT3|nr:MULTISPECIES: SulP family inorganic anion transporter [Methylosinus]ATQ69524.1 SulP family inorganic anion transporter [Methylosinus trichosporium OB3b]OBS50512.1 sulfate transporter [Methylosinus sp. 3S-1]
MPARGFSLFSSLRHAAWRADLAAGVTLAAIAIPEQMATARLAGFPPQIGFFAFLAGSLAFAAFGANRFLSSGADSTIAPIFAGALALLAARGSPQFLALASFLALLVGAILVIGFLLRAGWIADLLSVPVTTGFLAGIAIHILISQLPALLGLPSVEGNEFYRVKEMARHWREVDPATLAIGLGALATIALGEKIAPRLPAALLALAGASLAVRFFDLERRGVAVLGAVSTDVPHPRFPEIAAADIPHLVGLAIIIAMVIMVQTAATSRSFPNEEGRAPDVDRDYLGVGAGCLAAGLVGAFAVDASPPRTAIVAATGGRSQLSSIVAALVIGALLLFGAALLAHVPEAALAGVLLFIAARIFRLHVMRDIARKTRAELALVALTMAAVVALPVQTGVSLAILLSLLHGVWTTTRTRLIGLERVPGTSIWWPCGGDGAGERLAGVLVAGFQAPLSFLNAYGFQRELREAIEASAPRPKLVVLEASNIVEIDYTAAGVLARTIMDCRAAGAEVAIARLESVRAKDALQRFGVMKTLGEGRLFRSVDEATRTLAPEADVIDP